MSTETKFKVGDKVRVKQCLSVGKTYYMQDRRIHDSFTDEMNILSGKTVTIEAILASGKYRIKEDMYGRNWVYEMFEEGVKNMPKSNQKLPKDVAQVFIDEKNNAVTVELSNGNKATAKCSQGDTFDAYVGFCIAYNKVKFGGKNGGVYDIKKMFDSCMKSANKKGYKVAILKNRDC